MNRLSVVIPTYNEEPNIRDTAAAVLDYLRSLNGEWELLLCDDGSTDDTTAIEREIAEGQPQVQLLDHTPNRGKGHAVRRGMLAASGDVRLFLDADYSTPIEEVEKFLPHLERGCDVVIGVRRGPDALVETQPPLHRYLLGELYIKLAGWVLGCRVSDFNCGFKAFTARAADRLFRLQRRDDWSFDAEVLMLADRLDYAVQEVPVRWAHAQATSKVHPLRDGIRSLLALFQVRRDLNRGVYVLPDQVES